MSLSRAIRFDRLRFWLATAATPLLLPTLYLVYATFLADSGWRRALDPGFLSKYLDIFWAMTFVDYVATLALGLPALLVLRRSRMRTTPAVVIVAALCGAVLILCGELSGRGSPGLYWPSLGIGGAVAALQGGVFSWVAGFPMRISPVADAGAESEWSRIRLCERIVVWTAAVTTVTVLAAAISLSVVLFARS